MKTILKNLTLCTVLLVAGKAVASPNLKAVFKDDFLIGAALNPAQFCESNVMEAALVKQHFNSISPENVLKWERVHPTRGTYDFTLADQYVRFGETNGMMIIGHTLVWHSQTPDWVFANEQGQSVSRDVLLERMREHIFSVVGRYKGRIKGWDVVNEAVAEDGTYRQSPWRKIIGPDYPIKAYQFAHEADPQAQLYYNDYGLENPQKRAGGIKLVKDLQAAGVKLTGVGLQGHYKLDTNYPTAQEVDDTIKEFSQLGLKVMITELDIDVLPSAHQSLNADVSNRRRADQRANPFPKELSAELKGQLAARYAEIFAVFLKHRRDIDRVTFWGVTDDSSWLNDWPVEGRTSYPLLFDRAGKPKPAFDRIIRLTRLSGHLTKVVGGGANILHSHEN